MKFAISIDAYLNGFSPTELERCFFGWVQQLIEDTTDMVIPIDGKTVKGSYDRSQKQSALRPLVR